MTTRNLSDSNYVSNQEGTSLLPLKRVNKGSKGFSSWRRSITTRWLDPYLDPIHGWLNMDLYLLLRSGFVEGLCRKKFSQCKWGGGGGGALGRSARQKINPASNDITEKLTVL